MKSAQSLNPPSLPLDEKLVGMSSVHREFGPGLDKADYERALHLELLAMDIEHEC